MVGILKVPFNPHLQEELAEAIQGLAKELSMIKALSGQAAVTSSDLKRKTVDNFAQVNSSLIGIEGRIGGLQHHLVSMFGSRLTEHEKEVADRIGKLERSVASSFSEHEGAFEARFSNLER